MSEQPVKCKMDGNCVEFTTDENCNTECEFYNPVDETIPESIEQQIANSKPVLQFSNLPKFDKKHEFVVLKKHVFQLQSISPKKIILKFKRKFNQNENIPDGCYIFKNPATEEILNQASVLRVLAKNTRDKNKELKEKALKEKQRLLRDSSNND